MASQSDARMFLELKERLDKVEELLTQIADQIQRMAQKAEGGETDLMPVMYPESAESK